MVMSETHSEKRKFGKAGESSVNKKARREVSKKYGKFTEDCIPDGVFPIGDDVFVFASTYYDSVSVHIRRFKKYGKTYYPTPEGITLDPRPDKEPTFKEISISREQWAEMIKKYGAIENAAIDNMFQCMDFLTAYKTFCEGPIENTLPSSLDVSLENKISHFKTQLPSPVCLNGAWEVGLSEIIYPHSWLSVNKTNNYFLYKAGDGNISSTVKRTIDVGCYETMLDIISAVQLVLPKNPNRFTIIYNKATKRVKINAVQGSSLHLENLGELLGFKRNAIIIGNMKSEFVADAWSNFSVFYVYSDLISPQIVGDTQAPLLRIVRTKGKDGETISQYYDRPQYLPLVRHSFQTIQSELRLNSGDFVPFERGQIGSGLTHYKGINFQKGYGIGGIFRLLFRAALPFLVKGGKTIGKEVLMTGSRVASDVLSGENFKQAVKTRSRESGKN
ncbi:uncharacterized protein TNCV_1448881 [Trichonephila clavipes]|nr:uncharacterized protein TNCV_1448881 [Trichonephila clavipes]